MKTLIELDILRNKYNNNESINITHELDDNTINKRLNKLNDIVMDNKLTYSDDVILDIIILINNNDINSAIYNIRFKYKTAFYIDEALKQLGDIVYNNMELLEVDYPELLRWYYNK